MNKSTHHPIGGTLRLLVMVMLVMGVAFGTGQTAQANGVLPTVDLGGAAPFVILSKAGVTNVPISDITGDIGVSPIAASSITGFSLRMYPTNTFSISSQVTGKIYAANYASPTPANLTTAISNMETAYDDASGRAPDFTELYAGDLSGQTLPPGVYKWSTGVLVSTNVTLAGPTSGVWIFEIAGDLTFASDAQVVLSGGAQAANIFWQVGGGAGAEIGTGAHVEGTILTLTAIHLRTGASLNGRALAQTAVTLDQNTLVLPKTVTEQSKIFRSVAMMDGWVLESTETSDVGGAKNNTATTFNLGDDAANKQYRGVLHFDTTGLPNNAVVTSVTLKINAQGLVGTDPFATLGNLMVDIRKPSFGANYLLALDDFDAPANLSSVGTFDMTPVSNWYSAVLDNSAFPYINLAGSTQFRLAFATDDNNNFIADYLMFYSGNAVTAARPQLIVSYYVP